jgi:hypothetical protein
MALIKSDFLIEANTRIRLESSQRKKKVKEFHGVSKSGSLLEKQFFHLWGENNNF